jgi:hypothetical protein
MDKNDLNHDLEEALNIIQLTLVMDILLGK